jgi:hypothetical protein
MANLEGVARQAEERKRAEERNPLLKLTLSELIKSMQNLVLKNPNLLSYPTKEIRRLFPVIGEQYVSIMEEIDRREREYHSYKAPLVFGSVG